ncbi:MAG TPA: hypothetical protein VGT98_03625 [Candidatus Elarobacter sp.]|nr:hypothetical protein [Candidatus Elarobacter sp.]
MRQTSAFVRAAPLLAILAAACSAREQPASTSSQAIHITGELLADGSCRASVNGAPVFAATDSARTVSLAGRAVNMAPPGHDMHELWCSPASADEPMIPDSPGDRALLVALYPRAGAPPNAQSYSIVREVPSAGGDAAAASASLSLFDPAHVTASDHPGIAYLAADSGTVTLTSVDGTHVVGTFSVRATQAWTM